MQRTLLIIGAVILAGVIIVGFTEGKGSKAKGDETPTKLVEVVNPKN
jgi:hypothetical protein